MAVVVVIPTFQSCQMVEEEKRERRGGGEFEAVGVCKNGAEASGSVDIKPPGTFRGPADDIGGCSFRKRNRPAASSAAWPCLWTGAHGIHTGYRVCEDEGSGHRCPGSLWVIKERPRLVPSPSGLALYEAPQQSRSNDWDAWGQSNSSETGPMYARREPSRPSTRFSGTSHETRVS